MTVLLRVACRLGLSERGMLLQQKIGRGCAVKAHPLPIAIVELEGVEPSSKRGNHKLSTCLSLTWFSCRDRTKAINPGLILFEFRRACEAARGYLRFDCTTEPECFGATASE